MFKRIIACFLVIVIIFSFAFSLTSYAIFPDIVRFAVLNFGDVIFSDHLHFTDYTAWLLDGRSGADACPSDPDGGAHVWTSDIALGTFTGYFNEHCMLCGITAVDYLSELETEKNATLDSTSANSASVCTGFYAPSMTSDSTSKPLSNLDRNRDILMSLGINSRVLIIAAYDTNLYGYYFDSAGRLCYGTFTNPWGSIGASCFGTFDLSTFEMTATRFDGYHGLSDNYVFYDSSYLKAYEKTNFNCYAIDWNATYSSWYNPQYYGERLYVPVFTRAANSSLLTDTSSNIYIESYGGNGTGWYTPWFYQHTYYFENVVTQPTGTDNTSRTGSLMQTINNYNVDNSVVDNSSNVNYYISPKSYVTELTDDTIDIEQCYSPQSYDEETLVFTEPVTGAQYLTTGWTYDYTTRTYDIDVASGTITDGDTIDITRIELIYGDEAVTYNYYLADDTLVQSDEYAYVMVSGDETFGTGSDEGDTGDEDHTHDYVKELTTEATCGVAGLYTYTCSECGDSYTEDIFATGKHVYTDTVTTEATCEAPGLRTYTCNECGDSYTEKINAAGHTWTVKQSVATEYDDTGAVTVQGYTIYKCSVCNTEYKDDAGTGPPNNSVDSGNDTEGLLKKIGKLIGSIISGIIDMITSVLGGILDALTNLADMLGEKLTGIVDTVMALFEKIPQMFGGFTALLGDVLVFIPEDIITIFTFGAAAIVFVGILLLFIKR